MSIDFGALGCGSGWSEEFDCVPLRLRRMMLRSTEKRTVEDRYIVEETICGHIVGNVNITPLVKTENCSSAALFTNASELPTHQTSDNSSCYSVDDVGKCDLDGNFGYSSIFSNKMPASQVKATYEQLNNPVGEVMHQITSDIPDNVLQYHLMGSSCAHVEDIEVKHQMFYEFDDALDSVLLKERQKMLVSRKIMASSISDIEDKNYGGLSNLSTVVLQSESNSIRDTLVGKNLNLEVNDIDLSSEFAIDGTSLTVNRCSPPFPVSATVSTKPRSFLLSAECKSFGTQKTAMMDACVLASSVSPLIAKVKDEPLDINDLCSEGANAMQNSCTDPTLTVKNEPGFSEFLADELDHMPLIDRVRLLSSGTPSLDVSGNPKCFEENVASASDFSDDILESVKPVNVCRPRKKRRTATDSVETALEEDAPGLLKVLLDRGVSTEEIKLYGEQNTDDILEDSLSVDDFAELEAVISQLFSQRQTFLKFPLLRTKGEKISYCLSCLLSLVEQTRYLRNRKWPVEWGWCRDLQSFIFVFQRHNRIVLERPEYGYATYFFELLNSVPVAWQVKRLVTAMKLTSCGRITLIENRPLVVGEDLNEVEARVLTEFGWTPNTGLGTMLNYCDRVVHDRKHELDSSEWRLKIGKQLMNGYNGGNIVAQNLPKRLIEDQDFQNVQVKLEE